uniref:Uncharacterized protein n=1 Tax=Arundo donax TaxID=35708 RepID=A0A0A9B379_ARUDO
MQDDYQLLLPSIIYSVCSYWHKMNKMIGCILSKLHSSYLKTVCTIFFLDVYSNNLVSHSGISTCSRNACRRLAKS